MAHTPLTRGGIAQAEAMGPALAGHFGSNANLDIWASPAGRTLQTVAIVAEHLGRDFFAVKNDPRLLEIDAADGRAAPMPTSSLSRARSSIPMRGRST